MTECNAEPLLFPALGRRSVEARFDGGSISSDAGLLLLREVEHRTSILRQFTRCFRDHRDPDRVEHPLDLLLAQRVFGLAAGYEDLTDHDELRHDPLFAAAIGKRDPGNLLAGKSTLNRLELTPEKATSESRYKKIVLDQEQVDRFLVSVFLQAHPSPPGQVILDLDATDDPLHGKQEGRFFHGYYRSYCYLPLYIFCGEHLLCARLRPSNIDGAAGSVEELTRIVTQIRESWPETRILIRGDAGFCREEILAWCEGERVDYVLGLARNARLVQAIDDDLEEAKQAFEESGEPFRSFRDFTYSTLKSWSRRRRVVAKAEHLAKGSNPRFVVTSLCRKEMDAESLYKDLYCARGDMENRIKEQQLYLFADRTSSSFFRANQIRLYFSSVAYLLMSALRRLGVAGTELAPLIAPLLLGRRLLRRTARIDGYGGTP